MSSCADFCESLTVMPYRDARLFSAFQPILDHTFRLVGYEALLRARVGAQEIPPAQLLYQNESGGDLALEQQALSMHIENFSRQDSTASLFLNVSPHFVLNGFTSLMQSLIRAIACGNIHAHQIVLEVLEHHAGCEQQLISRLQAFKKAGFRIAQDDFGCAYSNQTRAQQIIPDVIKLDQSLLVSARQGNTAPLHAAANAAREIAAQLLIEGVESHADVMLLKHFQIDFWQGYWFGKPHPVLVVPEQM